MIRKLSIGTLAAVLLMSGVVVGGMSHAREGSSDRLAAMTLNTGHCGASGVRCRFYGLTTDGKTDGQITTVYGPILDVDGRTVGRFRETCTYVGWTRNMCTQVFTLRSGPHTDRGALITTGILGEWAEGVNGRFAVTAGTVAYAGVVGQATKVWDGKDFIFTFSLMP